MSNIPGNFTDAAITIDDDANHSATLVLGTGEVSVENLLPNGREEEVYQSQGAVVGHRKGARAFPSVTITAILASPSAAFHIQAQGMTSGFVSTSVSIGDGTANDLTLDLSYGAESRVLYCDDARLTSFGLQTGSPSQVSMTFEILGPIVDQDGNQWVSSR